MVNKITGIKVLIVPVTVGISLLVSILFVKPAFDDMQTQRKKRSEIEKQLTDLEGQNKKLSELKAKWDSMADDKSLVEGALPNDASMDSYIYELNERASRSGILINSVSAKEKTSGLEDYFCGKEKGAIVSSANSSSDDESSGNGAGSGSKAVGGIQPSSSCVKGYSLDLVVTGNWEQIVNFFKYLEDTNRMANISSIAIKSNPSGQPGESNDLLSTTIGLSVFYRAKSEVSNSSIISSLASGEGFEENVIKKLNNIVFSPYVAPSISESGERNIFK
ncbi:MAG: type 4a pilus biogenesis protein PilO [Parcubacteria group bacterium]|jgi:Tfp pilus assembly protein PilO